MKKILFIIAFIFTLSGKSQDFEYTIKLTGVENLSDAKMATDYLRDLFEVYPTFIDSLDFFEFRSDIFIDKLGFEYYMLDNGYIVAYFYRTDLLGVTEERE